MYVMDITIQSFGRWSGARGRWSGATDKRKAPLVVLPAALRLGTVVLLCVVVNFGPVVLQPHGGGYPGEHNRLLFP
jgi:hypothetical protein